MSTAFLYSRVSTQEQALSGLSLSAQESSLVEYADRVLPGHAKLAVRDSGISAKIPLFDRPGGSEIKQLKSGDALVVAKLDRAWRSVLDFTTSVKQLDDHKITLHVLDLAVDTSTPNGRLLVHIVSALAEWERGVISQRTKEGLREARRQGKRLGGSPYPRGDLRKILSVLEKACEGAASISEACRIASARLNIAGDVRPLHGGGWNQEKLRHIYRTYVQPHLPRRKSFSSPAELQMAIASLKRK